ncbi:hypothetical protein GS876_15315 [Rhodococcus hoagii]|nr:hypothetical protein [Prescottella equi]
MDIGEFDEPHAVGEVPPDRGRDAQSEPGLADTADAGERHETAFGERATNRSEFVAATDETGEIGRESAVTGRRTGRLVGPEGVDVGHSATYVSVRSTQPRLLAGPGGGAAHEPAGAGVVGDALLRHRP